MFRFPVLTKYFNIYISIYIYIYIIYAYAVVYTYKSVCVCSIGDNFRFAVKKLKSAHYKNGDLLVLWDLALPGLTLHLSCAIRSEIFSAGPTFMPNSGMISSLVSCRSRFPSILFRLNVSQWAVQSFTRKNWDTSYTFHVSGTSSK